MLRVTPKCPNTIWLKAIDTLASIAPLARRMSY